MKTRTLVIAAVMAAVLMLFSLAQRSSMTGTLFGSALSEVHADEAEVVEDIAFEELVEAEAEPAPVIELAQAEPVVEETVEVIELDTERELSSGIEVAMGDEGKDLISITLDDVPLQDVVRMFTRISGANIVSGTNLTGSVTVSLQDVEWEPAFRVILDSADMVLIEKTAGIYSIMSKNDLAGEPVTVDTIFLNFTTVSNVQPVVNRMLVSTNASVSAFPSANALVVQETVARLNQIKLVIEQIDIPRPQVYIEAKFVELNDAAISDLGIDWSALGSDESGLGYTLGASGITRSFDETRRLFEQDALALLDLDTDSRSTLNEIRPERRVTDSTLDNTLDGAASLSGRNFTTAEFSDGTVDLETVIPYERVEMLSSLLSAEDFELTLSALKQNSGVDIISNPKVIVANEETATIHVGRNEPNVVAVPQGDTGDRFAFTLDSRNPFIEIGVKLEVTPTVNTEENITVRLTPELSRLIGQKEVGEGSTRITFPITQVRKVNTQFNLESGTTVAIGGLTETTEKEEITKLPILGDIPLLGKYLFSHTHTEDVQDEVIIFVTVGLANPENLVEVAGVPSGGRLIHEHLAREAAEAGEE